MAYHLTDEDAERVYHSWCKLNLEGSDQLDSSGFYILKFRFGTLQLQSRNSGKLQQFERWLFENGASLKRKDKKFYIEFFNEKEIIFFLMKWVT